MDKPLLKALEWSANEIKDWEQKARKSSGKEKSACLSKVIALKSIFTKMVEAVKGELKEITDFREAIEEKYKENPTGCGDSFGELLCYEIHGGYPEGKAGLTFVELAKKWGISVTFIGKLIADHCQRMEPREEEWPESEIKELNALTKEEE